jgi:hypothetical protein
VKTFSSEVEAELEADIVRPVYLVELVFTSTTIRLCSARKDIPWDGHDWLGNGWFKGLSNIRDTGDIQATNVSIDFTGLSATLIAEVLGDSHQKQVGRIYLAFLDADGDIIPDPELLFEGGLDQAPFRENGESSTLTLTYESTLVLLKQTPELRYTDQAQKALFPGDLGFIEVNAINEWTGFWGSKTRPKTSSRRPRSKR